MVLRICVPTFENLKSFFFFFLDITRFTTYTYTLHFKTFKRDPSHRHSDPSIFVLFHFLFYFIFLVGCYWNCAWIFSFLNKRTKRKISWFGPYGQFFYVGSSYMVKVQNTTLGWRSTGLNGLIIVFWYIAKWMHKFGRSGTPLGLIWSMLQALHKFWFLGSTLTFP